MDNEMSRGDTMLISIGAGSIFPKAIRIGYEGENVVTQIDFNLKKWIAEYGLGGVTLLVIRHGDTDAYPVPLMIEDGIASWSITETDTAKAGRGAIQLKYVAGEKIKKSPIYTTSCSNALDDSDTVPDPYDSWLATLTDLSTLVTAKAAESLVNADNAQASADSALASKSSAATSASNASASASQAALSAQSAQTAKTGATASAQTASTKASEASTSAQSAVLSAQTATDKATLASQKAAAASESATLATAKASAAATSETNAVTAANTATSKASQAAASATSAREYNESAQQSAVNAYTSATNAAASEAHAQEYAENASVYVMSDAEAAELLEIATYKGESDE